MRCSSKKAVPYGAVEGTLRSRSRFKLDAFDTAPKAEMHSPPKWHQAKKRTAVTLTEPRLQGVGMLLAGY